MSTLKLEDCNLNITRGFPHFGYPAVSGYFSLDEDRQYSPDFSNLKYYYNQIHNSEINLNLNVGFESFIKKSEAAEHEGLDKILKFILDNFLLLKNQNIDTKKILYEDVVCFRGLITVIMGSPYLRENWTVCIIKWKQTMYLCMFDKERQPNINNAERFNYWGRKFEQFVLTDIPNQTPDTTVPVNESLEFCCIFRTRLHTHRLLYGAEMDGVMSNERIESLTELRTEKFVEVKTTRHITTTKQQLNFHRFKLLKYWCQSFLVGINTIMIGKRDDNGLVTKIDKMKVSEIPPLCKGLWAANVCVNFFSDFLIFAREFIGDTDSPNEVFEFKFDHKSATVHATKLSDGSHRMFLSQWYVDGLTDLSTRHVEVPETQ